MSGSPIRCGISIAPAAGESVRAPMPHYARAVSVDWRTFGAYLERLAGPGLGENVAHLVGNGAVLLAVVGFVAADGMALATDGPLARVGMHPRCFGWTARLLARYVRDEQLLPLPEAIAKLTGRPAARAGLKDRGLVREGAPADLVVFDLARIRDNASYEQPNVYPDGFAHAFVNGTRVVAEGAQAPGLPGRVLRPEEHDQ